MTLKTLRISHQFADAWVAFDQRDGHDYYYGGTRMVKPSTPESDVHRMLSRLMSEESAFKNRLINLSLREDVLGCYNGRMPRGFMGSKVGGARCIIRPKDDTTYSTLKEPAGPNFDAVISAIFQEIGKLLNEQGGIVKLTPDFGRYAGLADILARFTQHVLGIRCEAGGCGGKSSYAATGIITALEQLGIDRYQQQPITLIGSAGALGSDVLKYIRSTGFKDVAICDLQYDSKAAVPPDGPLVLPSRRGIFTEECLARGGMIIATTYGEELQNSRWESIPPGSVLVLAHNLCIPAGVEGVSLMRTLAERDVYTIPGQILTMGGALTSRIEWFWRQSNANTSFDKELAHLTVRDVEKFLLSKISQQASAQNVTPCEAMLSFAQSAM